MKTAAAVLQELAVKLGLVPEYECISQSGPQHQATFEYRCTLCGETGTATARSKKDAKQEAARIVLGKLARAGKPVPPPWGMATLIPEQPPQESVVNDPHSYVALLKEYCEEYRLPTPEYTLVGDSGPPHLRSFTMRVTVGAHSRDATALNKKAARQMAAETIYKYLRGCLRSTQDFVEVDALSRSIDKKMGRFKEERKDLPWRPPLSQKISEYQCGLVLQFDESKRATAMEALRATAAARMPSDIQLACAATALGLEVLFEEMPTESGEPLITVELPTTSPSLIFMGNNRNNAASQMIDYLLMCLQDPPREPILVNLELKERKNSDLINMKME